MGRLDAANAAKARGRGKASPITTAIVAQSGSTPLQVMLKAMREFERAAGRSRKTEVRRELLTQAAAIAKDAAPYVHPKLAQVTHQGGDKPIQVQATVYVPKKEAPRG